jgi:hypothetical protein
VLELLGRDLAFSQGSLLTVDAFVRSARDRGLDFGIDDLEAAHRVGLLPPLFRVRRDLRAIRREAAMTGAPLNAYQYQATSAGELEDLARTGAVADAGSEQFRPWRRLVRAGGDAPAASYFLYSQYQLIEVAFSGWPIPGLARRLRGRGGKEAAAIIAGLARVQAPAWRRALLMLEALTAVYRPRVVHRVSLGFGSTPEEWDALIEEWDSRRALTWLGADPDEIKGVAERLLSRADGLDPNAKWVSLLGLVKPERWEQLTGPARTAIEARIAAEILLRFVDDLASVGVGLGVLEPEGRVRHPLHGRLHQGRESLDRVLTDFGLSPYPALLLVVEGETEEFIVPKLMKHLNFPAARSFIDILNGRTVEADLGPLAEHLVTPTWNEGVEADSVVLVRPVTRLLVVTDPEGRHATPEDRERRRQGWIGRVVRALPAEMRTAPVVEHVSRLIEIIVWPAVFEFAHFTNGELAVAVRRAWKDAGGQPWAIRARDVARLRATSQNLEDLWRNARPPRPSKPLVAAQLWETLVKRVDRALDEDATSSVPVLGALTRALELAREYPRARLWLKL